MWKVFSKQCIQSLSDHVTSKWWLVSVELVTTMHCWCIVLCRYNGGEGFVPGAMFKKFDKRQATVYVKKVGSFLVIHAWVESKLHDGRRKVERRRSVNRLHIIGVLPCILISADVLFLVCTTPTTPYSLLIVLYSECILLLLEDSFSSSFHLSHSRLNPLLAQ